MSLVTKVFGGLLVLVVSLSGWNYLSRDESPSVRRRRTEAVVKQSPSSSAVKRNLPSTRIGGPAVVSPVAALPATQTAVPTETTARAAATALVALDEQRMVTEATATALTAAVAAPLRRTVLVEQSVRQTRSLHRQLGDDITVLAQPLRARTVMFNRSQAEIDVWWVKIITGPARVTAGDIWGTTRVVNGQYVVLGGGQVKVLAVGYFWWVGLVSSFGLLCGV